MINKTKNTKMKTTTMKKIQTLKGHFKNLASFLVILFLSIGNKNIYAAENDKNIDSCCIVKTKLISKDDLNISIKLPSPKNWAFADYQITQNLYLELNPVLKATSSEEWKNSDYYIQQMFDENFKISNPLFDEADNTIQAAFVASNVLIVNNLYADFAINKLFWKENENTLCNGSASHNEYQQIPVKINQLLKQDWEKSDEEINLQILTTNTIQESGI